MFQVFERSCPNMHPISWVCGEICQLAFGISHDRMVMGNQLITTQMWNSTFFLYTPCISHKLHIFKAIN